MIGFVGLDGLSFATERAGGSYVFLHRLTNAVRHEPCGFVGNAHHTVQLVGRHALLAGGIQMKAENPLRQRIFERSMTVPTVTVK